MEKCIIFIYYSSAAHLHAFFFVIISLIDLTNVFIVTVGVSCPRAAFNSDKQKSPAEPYGQEALTYTKEMIMQREVDVEVETCDKGGNFIGWLFYDNKNIAISLVEVRYTKMIH